jgi:hypothetical protein
MDCQSRDCQSRDCQSRDCQSRTDYQSRASQAALESAELSETATPLPCFRPMIAQPLVAWTPARLLAAGAVALVSAPVLLLQPARRA